MRLRGVLPLHQRMFLIGCVWAFLALTSLSEGAPDGKLNWQCRSDRTGSPPFQITLSLHEQQDARSARDISRNHWVGEIQAQGLRGFPPSALGVEVDDKPVDKIVTDAKGSQVLPGRELSVHLLKAGNGRNWDGLLDRAEDLYLTAYLEITFFQGYSKGQGLLIYEVGYGEKDRWVEAIPMECQ